MIEITSDGFGFNTEVVTPNGEKLKGVKSIVIKEILPDSRVEAVITFSTVKLDVMVAVREARR